jgi:hypothetical protein
MASLTGEDLGHGVYASPGAGGELMVSSPRLDLPWRAAEGQVPGTAVLWRGQSFEVVGRMDAGSGARWTLRRWDEPTAMRSVFNLDREYVGDLAAKAEAEVRNRRTRVSTVILLPVLGFAPAAVQKKWANEWGFAADRATLVSAIIELLVGAAGTVQMAAAAFGADFFMPPLLAFPGPVLFIFGAARLAMVFGDGEPVGSPIGAPFLLFAPKTAAEPQQARPTVSLFEEDGGRLVLASPILRRDWDRDGLLRYRDGLFRLERIEQEGRFWVYHFERGADGGEGERVLQLRPPAVEPLQKKEVAPAPPSFLRTMLMTAAMTLGPAADQERWASEQGIKALWLTALGAVAELIGGVANLNNDLGSAHPLLILLDFYLVGEGLVRLGSALAGRPMGSVFGWLLRPLYRRHLP